MTLTYQGSLFGLDATTSVPPLAGAVRRTPLSDGAWIDLCPGWLSGADALFERLVDKVAWVAEKRPMYDRIVDVPRLLAFYDEGQPLPDPALTDVKAELDRYYSRELAEPFATAGLCFYRDGRDSVAWHGDRIGRSRTEDTMVAIVSVGTARTLALRPHSGGPSLRFELGHGDLIVMGGSCQRTWDHAIPKTTRVTGGRVSIQFRPRGVR